MGASSVPRPLLLSLLLLATAAANPDNENRNGFSLTFVFDSTGSMRDELTQVKQAMQEIFDYMKTNHAHEIQNFALVEFNDPYAKLLTVTTNAETYRKNLDKIRVRGGGDCPEMAMKGIKLALEKSLPKSYIFVFTDASAKDYKMQNEIENLIQRQQSKVVFVLTGKCKGEKEPGYQVYNNVARVSNGHVFNLLKKEVTKVLEFIKLDTKRKSVIKTGEVIGKKTFKTPVDPSMTEMTITITGRGGEIDLTDPTGKKEDGKTILDLQAVKSKQVINPKSGNWTVGVKTISPGRFVIMTESSFNFVYGFSLNPTKNMQETAPRPLIGRETAFLIQVTNQTSHIELINVKIKDTQEKTLKTLTLTPVLGKNDTFTAEMFLPPTSVFFLEIHGRDSMNNEIVRVSDSGISPQLPALPIINMKSELTATLNFPFVLLCHVESLVPFSGSWIKGNETVMSSKKFLQSAQVLYNISKTEMSSGGTYTCKAKNDAGSTSKNVTLKIQVMPVLAYGKSNETSIVGQQKELTCLIKKANPLPKFTWYKDGKVLKTNDTESKILTNGSLLISYIKPTDEGTYKCEATNDAGQATRSFNLTVYKIPVFYNDQYVKIQARLDTSVKLTCKSYGRPVPKIIWMKDSKPVIFSPSIYFNSEDGSLHISSTKKENNGTYECLARNIMGQSKRKIDLLIEDPPQISLPNSTEIFADNGEEITLLCEVQAFPAAEIKWFKNGIPYEAVSISYSNNNSSVRLVTDLSTSGEYSCFATNKAGSDQITIKVIVTVAPSFEDNEEYLHARRGEHVILSCDTDAFPPATYYWQKYPDKKLPVNNSTITIENVDERNAGLYYCYASNKAGDAQKAINLKINVPPLIKAELPKTHTIKKNSFLNLPCYAQGEPSPEIHWLKNGSPFLSSEDGNVLEIHNATEKDAGVYACVATNSEGSDEKIVELKFKGIQGFNGQHHSSKSEKEES